MEGEIVNVIFVWGFFQLFQSILETLVGRDLRMQVILSSLTLGVGLLPTLGQISYGFVSSSL